jgi:hypothetical protein
MQLPGFWYKPTAVFSRHIASRASMLLSAHDNVDRRCVPSPSSRIYPNREESCKTPGTHRPRNQKGPNPSGSDPSKFPLLARRWGKIRAGIEAFRNAALCLFLELLHFAARFVGFRSQLAKQF